MAAYPRCGAALRNGQPCLRTVEPGSEFCVHHARLFETVHADNLRDGRTPKKRALKGPPLRVVAEPTPGRNATTITGVVLNLLSVGAAYGILVLVFQHSWAEGILGFQSNHSIASWLPLFMFVVLFGLSMDYHVFILSRVKELHDAGESTENAVRHAIIHTAGTVTNAALIMVAVFGLFATISTIDVKQMGSGSRSRC